MPRSRLGKSRFLEKIKLQKARQASKAKKSTKVTYGELDFGKIKKVKNVKNLGRKKTQAKIVKLNGKTQFYSLNFKDGSKIDFSAKGRTFLKNYPEIHDFLKDIFFEGPELTPRYDTKDISKNIKVINQKNKKNFMLDLEKIVHNHGFNHQGVYKFTVKDFINNKSHNFFIKISLGRYLGHKEFIANQAFQKYGINTIKPHYAYTNQKLARSMIVYDFTNMMTVNEAYARNKISIDELYKIMEKISDFQKQNLPVIKKFTYDKKGFKKEQYGKKGIGDYARLTNIFMTKTNGKIQLFFTDLLIDKIYDTI